MFFKNLGHMNMGAAMLYHVLCRTFYMFITRNNIILRREKLRASHLITGNLVLFCMVFVHKLHYKIMISKRSQDNPVSVAVHFMSTALLLGADSLG